MRRSSRPRRALSAEADGARGRPGDDERRDRGCRRKREEREPRAYSVSPMRAVDGVGVVAIFGPTGSGKSDVAEALAGRVSAELVSADAMQVYRDVPILTNQSARAPRLVGVWPLEHEGSVAEYQRLAHAAIDDTLRRGRLPVVVGGTGLYLRAALSDLALPPPPAEGVRERLQRLVDVVQRIAAERNARRIGLVEEVLVEGPSRTDPVRLRGRTRRNTTVNFSGDARPGELVRVEIEGATSTTLSGRRAALVAA